MRERIYHNFPPVWAPQSRVLILGSMPSVKSLEQNFYYAHPQNRFWKVLARVTGEPLPESIEEKKKLLITHGVALWDVLESCVRAGSLDSDIRDARPNDIPALLKQCGAEKVFTNGKAAEKYLKRFFPQLASECLPSTSPANAGNFSWERWQELAKYIK